ncbi:hypothetical protein [Amycolatopsis sp. PS_44_ISF1]|uniref:hypothetical protein n=1 Tax=Amycolatopsis sp. PS_44_ISF1 TaxID=2974917 RepID=UPI0028DD9FBF|nr:hypothetical protein [Amycolatopsis sp. PS_44_ISF1]MDT8912936.1 hypothetical protein [Amycolatopsis sp. PS_44_ISF1]
MTRPVRALVASLALALTATAAAVAPAHADDTIVFGPPGSIGLPGLECQASEAGQTFWELNGQETHAVLTDFTAINVAPGTTTTRTTTLTRVNTVNKTVTNTTGGSVSSTVGFKLFVSASASVSATYNHAVSTSVTTTDTEQQAVTWNFNAPGFYGLYRGTIRSDWAVGSSTCVRQSSGQYLWHGDNYAVTVFTDPEEGSVLCTGAAPTLPDFMVLDPKILARKQLGNC